MNWVRLEIYIYNPHPSLNKPKEMILYEYEKKLCIWFSLSGEIRWR